jgi:hypothetical protein
MRSASPVSPPHVRGILYLPATLYLTERKLPTRFRAECASVQWFKGVIGAKIMVMVPSRPVDDLCAFCCVVSGRHFEPSSESISGAACS